jgi:hypothetical protein
MNFLATITEDEDSDKILALGVVRPIASKGDGLIPYEHDENGKHLFVDLFLSKHPMGLAGLTAIFSKRFGPRESIIFLRKEETAPREYSFDEFRQKTLNKTPRAIEASPPKGAKRR